MDSATDVIMKKQKTFVGGKELGGRAPISRPEVRDWRKKYSCMFSTNFSAIIPENTYIGLF